MLFLWLAYGLFLLIMAPYAVIALAGIGSWIHGLFQPESAASADQEEIGEEIGEATGEVSPPSAPPSH